MKVDERADDPRPWKKRVLLPKGSAVVGRSLITERISRQKTLGWVKSLEGTSSEWAAGAHVHQEDACGAALPCAELKWMQRECLGGG